MHAIAVVAAGTVAATFTTHTRCYVSSCFREELKRYCLLWMPAASDTTAAASDKTADESDMLKLRLTPLQLSLT